MNNNLPQMYKNRIFNRIKSFFVNLFSRKDRNINIEAVDVNDKKEKANDFKKNLFDAEVSKVNYEKGIKKSIIETIEEKPELIETISNENLKKLIKIYDEIIKENNMKIERLKNKA